MADKLQNPIADPVKKPHKALEFDIQEVEDDGLPVIDKEDEFDVRVPDDDDFDI